ncbi:MAG: DUF4158 domain-containing protein [Gammaproteobacteria bacterium]|nr:DUF4158 domain-containing protein [Gammaproteobacteria bacterium]
MNKNKRISILNQAEIEDLYGVPDFNQSYQQFYFALNDREWHKISQLRDKKLQCVAVALLGYFKCKPILLSPNYLQMHPDLRFIAEQHFGGFKFRRFKLKPDQKSRVYDRVLKILGYANWKDKLHQSQLVDHLLNQATSWAHPRFLFDASIEYLSTHKIAIQ